MASKATNKKSTQTKKPVVKEKPKTAEKSAAKKSVKTAEQAPLTLKSLKEDITLLAEAVKELINKDKEPDVRTPEAVVEAPVQTVEPVSAPVEEPVVEPVSQNVAVPVEETTVNTAPAASDTGSSLFGRPWFVGGTPAQGRKLGISVLAIGAVVGLLMICLICRSMTSKFLVEPLNINMPNPIQVGEYTDVPVNINGFCGLEVSAESPAIDYKYEKGVLSLRPESEGQYTFAVSVIGSSKAYLGAYSIEAAEDLSIYDYKELTNQITQAVNLEISAAYRSCCKEIAMNFRTTAKDKTLKVGEDFIASARQMNIRTLHLDKEDTEADGPMKASWLKLMNADGQVPEIMSRYITENMTTEKWRTIFLAVAAGFDAVN